MFSSEKILQVITYLLSLNDGKMNMLKLMKELYLIDREAIQERETSVSGDTYFSMKNGPVLSATLNMLDDLDYDTSNPWGDYLQKQPTKYYPDVVLKKEAGDGCLSEKDKEYIETVSSRFKDYNEFQIKDYTHDLPEWKEPRGAGREKIRYSDIMKALGRSDKEIAEAKEEYGFFSMLHELRC
jgi:hypothetical protein